MVPSSDALRYAALSASWARDRRVARKRLALRWLIWVWWRLGLPALLALALAVWLLWRMPPADIPVWLKPLAPSVQFTESSGADPQPATASPHSKNAPHSKEP